jgi:hypothetical protein
VWGDVKNASDIVWSLIIWGLIVFAVAIFLSGFFD